jgi:hypothetical protein
MYIGRSPAVLTMEFKSLLKMSKALFGRKFDFLSTESMKLVDDIDIWRKKSVCIYMYIHTHMCIHKYIYTYIHSYRHTYIDINRCKYTLNLTF